MMAKLKETCCLARSIAKLHDHFGHLNTNALSHEAFFA